MQADELAELQRFFATALFTAAAAYLHQLWKYNRDAYQARVDEACKLIIELADLGAEYWVTSKLRRRSIRRATSEIETEPTDLIKNEIRIDGHLSELQFYRLLLERRLSMHDRQQLIELTAAFQDAMTGDNFGAVARSADPAKAKQVYVSACDLIAHLRQGADRGNKWWRIVLRLSEAILPYKRPPSRRGRIEETFWLIAAGICLAAGVIILLVFMGTTWLASG